MENIKEINNTDIPNSVLVKGVSHDDFVKLLNELKNLIVNEGITTLNNYQKMIDTVKKNAPNGSEEWADRFLNQVNEANKVINEEYIMIEELFQRIFKDWEEYQRDHVSVLETDNKENNVSEEKGDTNE